MFKQQNLKNEQNIQKTEKHNRIYLPPYDRKRLATLDSKKEHGVRLTTEKKTLIESYKGRGRKNTNKNERFD